MIKRLQIIFLFSISFYCVNAQNVGIGTFTPDSSAALEIKSSTQGFLPPRMTTAQRNAIINPAVGLQIYNTTSHCLEIFDFGKWNSVYCVSIDSNKLVADIDGNIYPIVKICNQTWMAKNLDVARYRNGDLIPQVTDPTQWANLTTGAWCWYNNDSATYGSVYGRLYNWYAVNDPRGLAPQGWHVPSDAEWNTISDCLGGANVAGGKLKESGTLHWNSPNTGATNVSEFNGLPGGARYADGSFNDINNDGAFWTSTQLNSSQSFYRDLYYQSESIIKLSPDKKYGYAVRCIKGYESLPSIDSGLVAYYPFNGNANDESGNGNHGVINGATLTTDRFGKTNKAYQFQNNNSIRMPYLNTSMKNNFSYSVWVLPQSNLVIPQQGQNGGESSGLSTNCCVIHPIHGQNYGSAQNNAGSGLYVGINGVYLEEHSDGWEAVPISFQSNNLNDWHLYTIIYENKLPKLYIDGVFIKSGISSLRDIYGSLGPDNFPIYTLSGIGAGYYPGSGTLQYFNGKIDDIRYYNRPLTQAEITYLATH